MAHQNRACLFPGLRLKPFKRPVTDATIQQKFRDYLSLENKDR
jgi:hypothetical protein